MMNARTTLAIRIERHAPPEALVEREIPLAPPGAPLGRLVVYGLSEAATGRRRNWLKAAWAWLRTPRFHPLSLIQPNLGVLGVHLLHLGAKEHLLRPALEEIYGAVDAGELRPIIDRVLPLDRDGAVAAHAHLHARRAIGKVVLATQEEENPHLPD